MSSGQSRAVDLDYWSLREAASQRRALNGHHWKVRGKHLGLGKAVMLPMNEMLLVTGGGRHFLANAIVIMSHFVELDWACFFLRLVGRFPDEGVSVDVIGLRAERSMEMV